MLYSYWSFIVENFMQISFKLVRLQANYNCAESKCSPVRAPKNDADSEVDYFLYATEIISGAVTVYGQAVPDL